MSIIENIFKQYNVDINKQYPPSPEDIKNMMIDYANWYARKCLIVAADNAEAGLKDYEAFVYKTTITNIQLPEHD